MQSSFLPYVPKCEQFFGSVYGRIVKHDYGLAPDVHGEVVQKTNHRVSINAFPSCEPIGMTTTVNHGEAVEPLSPLGRNINPNRSLENRASILREICHDYGNN